MQSTKIALSLLVILLVGCAKEGGSSGSPFTDVCYVNRDSGQRLICLTSDKSYKLFFDNAVERGTWTVNGPTLSLTRSKYWIDGDGNPDQPLEQSYSCNLGSTQPLVLSCTGASHTKGAVTTSLTPDGMTIEFTKW